MPTDGLSVVLEGGAVEIEVLFFSDVLRFATGTRIREGFGNRITEPTESRWVAGGWREPTHLR